MSCDTWVHALSLCLIPLVSNSVSREAKVCQYLKLSYYAPKLTCYAQNLIFSNLFGYHHAQKYAGIIHQGLAHPITLGLVSCMGSRNVLYYSGTSLKGLSVLRTQYKKPPY